MKKIYIFAIVILSICGIVGAAWLFSITSTFNADVESYPGYIKLIIPFDNVNINATDKSDMKSTTAKFLANKELNALITIQQTIQDNSGGECTNGENDCQLIVSIRTGNFNRVVYNGQNITIPNFEGIDKFIEANLSCVAYSCPQSRQITVGLIEIR